MSKERRFSIVHIHPTLSCNLECLHCYSSSGPGIKNGLELDTLLPYLNYLRRKEKFNVISVSGGEPFLYRELSALLQQTREMGYFNQMVSNGMLLKSEKNKATLDYVDSIAISIDGPELIHNEIRASKNAYQKMLEGIEVLQQKQIPFGFIHTITKKSWQYLPEIAELAVNCGATLLQLHPIESSGRANTDLNDEFFLSQEDLHKIFILVSVMKESSPINIQFDLLHKHFIKEQPDIVFGKPESADNIKELLKEIIITEQGQVLPISYGFSDQFQIHHLKSSISAEESMSQFLNIKGEKLRELLIETYHKLTAESADDLINWSAAIVEESHNCSLKTPLTV